MKGKEEGSRRWKSLGSILAILDTESIGWTSKLELCRRSISIKEEKSDQVHQSVQEERVKMEESVKWTFKQARNPGKYTVQIDV